MSYPPLNSPLMDDSQKHREEPTMKNSNSTSKIEIREVWSHNLEQEFAHIREIVDDYPYLAMDTEFPGIVVRHVKRTPDYNYQTMKANVDMLKLIQLGLTFSDAYGNLPVVSESGKPCVWQFNFREFDLRSDLYAADSIELLQRSGIDFSRNRELGINAGTFAELLMPSGVVLNDSVRWITFHSAYDFGYLLKLLTCRKLPPSEPEFLELLRLYFPTIYDVKHLMRFCGDYHLHGGLDRLAQLLQVKRHGCSHQAGSDSLLTSSAYLSLLNRYFNGCAQKYAGVLYGLGSSSDFAGALSPAAGC